MTMYKTCSWRWPTSSRLSVTLAALALLGGCGASGHRNTADAVSVSGTVETHDTDLAFQVGGRIAELSIDEGAPAAVDQVVAKLEPKDYEIAVARAEAQANAAKAVLAALRAGTRPQELRVAEANLARADAELAFADADLRRIQELFQRKLESADQFEQAQLRREVARATREQARQNLQLLREGPRREEIDKAEADYAAALAALDDAHRRLSYTRLSTPSAGVIIDRLAEPGEVVAPGQAVLRVSQPQRPWVRAYLNETQLSRVKLGQRAQVRVDGLSDKHFEGTLTFISPQAEFTPKTVETRELRVDLVYRIKVDVDNPDGLLKVGMPADVILATGTAQ